MGLMDVFMKMNLATKGQDPTQAMYAGLAGLGLNVTSQQGAMVELKGTFQGKEAEMFVDGSNVMQAGNQAMVGGLISGVLGAIGGMGGAGGMGGSGGIGGSGWLSRRTNYRSHNRMQFAKMVVEWRVAASRPIMEGLSIGRDGSIGTGIGGGLYASASVPALEQPELKAALESVKFDEITINGGRVQAYWSPEMNEYQKISASPELYTEASRKMLDLLAKLADAL